MQNKKNTTFLALLKLFFLHWNGLKSDLNHVLKYIFGGLICQKENPQINKNFEKWPKIRDQI